MKTAIKYAPSVKSMEHPRAVPEQTLVEIRARLSELLNRLGARLIGRVAEQKDNDVATVTEPDAITRRLQSSVALMGQLAAGLAMVDADMLPAEGAGFGSTVRLRDDDTSEVAEYTLMVGSLVDLEANQVSLASPMGQALLGCVAGDEISIITPHRPRRLHVLSVRTLEQMLDSNELRIASN